MVGDAYRLHTLLDTLTGLPPMFPKWALRLFNGEFAGITERDMDTRGVKMVGIMKPRIHRDTVQGRYATQAGFWVHQPFYTDYFDHGMVPSRGPRNGGRYDTNDFIKLYPQISVTYGNK